MFVYSASFSPSPLDNALTLCPAAPGLQPQRAKFIPAGALFTSLVLFTAWSILPRTRQWPSPGWTVRASPSSASAMPRLPYGPWKEAQHPALPTCLHTGQLVPLCPFGRQRGDVDLHGLLLVQHGSVVAQVATASISAGWWHTITQGNTGCKLSNEGAAHPIRNWPGTIMRTLTELHVSCNHAWVFCSPYLTPQRRATGSGCHAPIPVSLMGSHGLRGQS